MRIERDKNGSWLIFDGNEPLGTVGIHHNAFHAKNVYLDICDPNPEQLAEAGIFTELRKREGAPLQVMASSDDRALARALQKGGFVRKRRCHEMDVTRAELLEPLGEPTDVLLCTELSADHEACCALLYQYYRSTHEAVNPLTATFEMFCADIPKRALYWKCGAEVTHAAFVEGNEIAYLCAAAKEGFDDFAAAVASWMFQQYARISFEADDTDPAASALRVLFRHGRDDASYDTYILE